ncbi:MAG: glycoside hydrolase family 38 C-terminal domain-containing protein, partial [Planctomycetota bacterium]
ILCRSSFEIDDGKVCAGDQVLDRRHDRLRPVFLPCGEALARSLVYGNRKIAELRGGLKTPGRGSDVCWIPDVFGYANCLPQILKLGGVGRFYTTKIAWSSISRFPYTSFVWRGADGSEVLTHLATTDYNGSVELARHERCLSQHRQSDVHPEMLFGTGYGDGGGGMTEAMCERARRLKNLAGAAKHEWTTSEPFFDRLEKVRNELPVYQGELYLEYHRGVQTSQSEYKRLYRACEIALQAHEAIRVADGGAPLGEDAWLRTLFGQFHDALPGSSIGLVYKQLNAEYEQVVKRELDATADELSRGEGRGALVFNPLPLPRSVVVDHGNKQPVLLDLPAVGTARWPQKAEAETHDRRIRKATTTLLDNGHVSAGFDRKGQLATMSSDGVTLPLTGSEGFVLYHDQPHAYDAWDIDHYTNTTGERVADSLKLELVEDTPVRATLRGHAKIGASSELSVSYTLEAGSRHLRIEAEVDWREDSRLLRYAVPTSLRGRNAIYGSPFGSIRRPQVPGVQRDEAMWENPGSRWVAVTDEAEFGVALVTEAKYGFTSRDGLLQVSLLKAPKFPDPNADLGRHRIRIALGQYQAETRGD